MEKKMKEDGSMLEPSIQSNWQPQEITQKDINYASWLAFFAWVFAVYDFILFGTLLPVMGQHFGWNETIQASIATWIAVGGAVVAFIIGPIVDKIGRRKGIIFTMLGTAISSALTPISAGLGKGALTGVRSVAGLGYAEEAVNATYLTEMYAASKDEKFKKRKGFIYSLVQSGWPVGALAAAALTAILLPHIGWQGCFVFAAVPAFVIAILARKLKESPQFQVIQRIQQLKKEGHHELAHTLAKQYDLHEDHHHVGVKAAFKGKALRPTIVLSLAILFNWSAIQVFSVLGTSVIVNVHNLSFQNSLLILILSNFVGFIGYLAHGWLGDRIGRRNTVGIGWLCGGIAFYAMIVASHDLTMVIALYSLGLFFLTGPYSAMLFFMGESFSTSIRATGGAIIHAMGPIGAILAGVGITTTLSSGGSWATAAIWFGAVPCFLSGAVMFLARHVHPEEVK